ncbi:MAG: AAA family ATPase [Candidatus Omnitrophica bacterium]|nr:AAA family ATPase [Candidatus Omnitrophota bacterium]
MKIVSVANQKGGCGKTTTAINLAGALAKLGKKTLLIDLDPQAHASYGLGISSQAVKKSIYNVLTDIPEKRCALNGCIVNVLQNLDLIPSNILLSTLEQELKDKEDAVSRLNQVLSGGKLNYDYVIMDCPPSLGFLTFNALRASELIIVPIDMSAFSLMGVGMLLGMLELIKVKIFHAPRVNAVATLFDKRTKYSQTMLEEIRAFFKGQTLDAVIRNSVALKKAVYKGIPVTEFEAGSNGAMDHIALAREILQKEGDLEFEKAMEDTKPGAQEPEITPAQEGPLPARTESPILPASFIESIFSIQAPTAKDVYIVGDFNNWKINDESKLSKINEGRWEKRLNLTSGKYRYKFVVDGEWQLDSRNNEREMNPFGTFDSIIKL